MQRWNQRYCDHTVVDVSPLSPCYQENDPQWLPGDGKQEQSDSWAESDEGAAEKHRRRHVCSLRVKSAASSATRKRLVFF